MRCSPGCAQGASTTLKSDQKKERVDLSSFYFVPLIKIFSQGASTTLKSDQKGRVERAQLAVTSVREAVTAAQGDLRQVIHHTRTPLPPRAQLPKFPLESSPTPTRQLTNTPSLPPHPIPLPDL